MKGLSNLLVPLLPLLYSLRPVAPGTPGQALGREEQQDRYLSGCSLSEADSSFDNSIVAQVLCLLDIIVSGSQTFPSG